VERAHRGHDHDAAAVAAEILDAGAHRGGVAEDLERRPGEGHARSVAAR
jgi:hypothetical protein